MSARPESASVTSDATNEQGATKKKKKRPKRLEPIEELLGESLVNAKEETTSPKSLVHQDGVIGLYFGAMWCPPCRAITPELATLYEEVRKADNHLEIALISFDRTQESFKEYLSKMPWWAVPYDNEEKREDVSIKFGIMGIPMLLFLDATSLEVITRQGRNIILNDPEGHLFPWKNLPDPVQYLQPPPSLLSLDDSNKSQEKEGSTTSEKATDCATAGLPDGTEDGDLIHQPPTLDGNDIVADDVSESVPAATNGVGS